MNQVVDNTVNKVIYMYNVYGNSDITLIELLLLAIIQISAIQSYVRIVKLHKNCIG